MKRILLIGLLVILLPGCAKSSALIDRVMLFRAELLQSDGCTFTADVTADYSQHIFTFKMRCKSDKDGSVTFEVISPESIAGITGILDADGGKLTFDDHALLFSVLADGRLSPVSAPWVMMRALRSGYIKGCSETRDSLSIHIDDSYHQDAMQVIIQSNSECRPTSAEIYYRGSRILTIVVEDFSIL